MSLCTSTWGLLQFLCINVPGQKAIAKAVIFGSPLWHQGYIDLKVNVFDTDSMYVYTWLIQGR